MKGSRNEAKLLTLAEYQNDAKREENTAIYTGKFQVCNSFPQEQEKQLMQRKDKTRQALLALSSV